MKNYQIKYRSLNPSLVARDRAEKWAKIKEVLCVVGIFVLVVFFTSLGNR